MSPDEVKQTIESTFTPYRCQAILINHDEGIKFRIYDKDNIKIAECEELDISRIDESHLNSVLQTYKVQLEANGFKLD